MKVFLWAFYCVAICGLVFTVLGISRAEALMFNGVVIREGAMSHPVYTEDESALITCLKMGGKRVEVQKTDYSKMSGLKWICVRPVIEGYDEAKVKIESDKETTSK